MGTAIFNSGKRKRFLLVFSAAKPYIRHASLVPLPIALLFTCLSFPPNPVAAEEAPIADAAGQTAKDDGPGEREKDAGEREKKSFWFIGTSNYHLRLEESEKRIDRQLNKPFGLLLPNWHRPATFKDWSEDWQIWDLWAGYGRDLGAKTAWSVYAGGGAGTVYNSDYYYPLGVPMEFDVNFTRRSFLLGSSVSYYPFGKPQKRRRGLKKSLAATRPVAEMNLGYTHQTVIGDVTISLPMIGNAIHVKDKSNDHLFWASPRLGLETPLTDDQSLNMLTGYLFFNDHADEFNGGLLEFFVRRRF